MEAQLITYILKANVALVLFYLLYLAAFSNDTFLMARRYYFLFAMIFSLIFPAIFISGLENIFNLTTSPQQVTPAVFIGETKTEILQDIPATMPIDWSSIVKYIYATGVVILAARLLIQIGSILKIYRRSKHEVISGQRFACVPQEINPFSFFNLVFIHPDLHSREELEQIVLHEKTHVRQLHSIDTMLAELLCMLFWWNPASWLIRREMRINLEYLADHSVIDNGIANKTYQYHLLRMTNHEPAVRIATNFNVSQLKKRIIMMNKTKTPMLELVKYALILPLAFTLITANSCMSNSKEPANADEETTAIDLETIDPIVETPKDDSEVFVVVEEQPLFPGGNAAMMKFLGDNIKYPVEAQEKGLEGRVILNFVVEKDGALTDIQIVRGVDPLLDNEAARVIKSMPNWEPGKQRGEVVRVRFTLPTVFRLLAKDKASENKDQQTTTSKSTNDVFSAVDEQPLFPGGNAAMIKFLGDNIKYPVEAQDKEIQGRVIVNFVVEKDGSLTDFNVVHGVDPLLDDEAVRVVKAMPNWTPGKQKGEVVRVRFTLPVVFSLSK